MVSQKVTLRMLLKSKNPNPTWVLIGQIFPWTSLDSASSYLVMVRNNQKMISRHRLVQVRLRVVTGGWLGALWLQQQSEIELGSFTPDISTSIPWGCPVVAQLWMQNKYSGSVSIFVAPRLCLRPASYHWPLFYFLFSDCPWGFVWGHSFVFWLDWKSLSLILCHLEKRIWVSFALEHVFTYK